MVWMSTNASFCAITMLRSTTGMLAAKPTPCCSRRSFTASMTGPSCTETVPSPPIASAAFGSPCTAATKAWWLRVSAARQISAKAGDSTSRSTMPETSDCSPCVAGASSSPSACSARGGRSSCSRPSKRSEVSVGMSTCSSIAAVTWSPMYDCTAGSSASGANVATNWSVSTSWMPRPRRDHGDGCEQQGDDDEHDGGHGAPRRRLSRGGGPAASVPSTGFAVTATDRNAAFSASSFAILASSSDVPASDISAPFWSKPSARRASSASPSMYEGLEQDHDDSECRGQERASEATEQPCDPGARTRRIRAPRARRR